LTADSFPPGSDERKNVERKEGGGKKKKTPDLDPKIMQKPEVGAPEGKSGVVIYEAPNGTVTFEVGEGHNPKIPVLGELTRGRKREIEAISN